MIWMNIKCPTNAYTIYTLIIYGIIKDDHTVQIRVINNPFQYALGQCVFATDYMSLLAL